MLQNFLAILDAAGAEKRDVLKVTAYIVGSENWPLFNQAFAEAFGDHRPSRSVVPVPELHHGYLIEIDGVAVDAARVKAHPGSADRIHGVATGHRLRRLHELSHAREE